MKRQPTGASSAFSPNRSPAVTPQRLNQIDPRVYGSFFAAILADLRAQARPLPQDSAARPEHSSGVPVAIAIGVTRYADDVVAHHQPSPDGRNRRGRASYRVATPVTLAS